MTDKAAMSMMSAIKEQFTLVGILVVLIGTVFTDYYYASFGLRYQALNLPASHIVYRGLTVLRDAPYVAIPYFVAVLWFMIESGPESKRIVARHIRISYLVIGLVLISAYWLASIAGRRAADRDLSSKSTLPKIELLLSSGDAKWPCSTPEACRLLMIDGDYLYVFTPTESSSASPNVLRLDKKAFREISTGTQ